MKRDMDLVRRIALTIADAPPEEPWSTQMDDVDPHVLMYHLGIMEEAGLITIGLERIRQDVQPAWSVSEPPQLTWAGNDFLDVARDGGRWGVMKGAISQAGGFTFELIKAYLAMLAKDRLGLPA